MTDMVATEIALQLEGDDADVLQLSNISKRATGWVDQAPSHAATSNSLLMN